MPPIQWRHRADRLTPQALGGMTAEEAAREYQVFMEDIEHQIAATSWSDPVAWTPRVAALEYSTATWLEPTYGDPDDVNMPAVQYGRYRTLGQEVDAFGLIVYGAGHADPGDGGEDGLIYLSLPLPVEKMLPDVLGLPLREAIANYTLGDGFGGLQDAGPIGQATWSTGYDPVADMTAGTLVLPITSAAHTGTAFPDDTPPADLASWCNATSPDASVRRSMWAWGIGSGVDFTADWPITNYDWGNPTQSGMVLSWRARYFTSAA